MTTSTRERPAWEVADVIRQHGAAFLAKHGGWLTSTQRQALRDLARCRTAALGGHVEHCLDCGHERRAYNSCRNRHCPKCQALARARWLRRETEHLLPVAYYVRTEAMRSSSDQSTMKTVIRPGELHIVLVRGGLERV